MGFPSLAVSAIPMHMAVERMNDMGYEIEIVVVGSPSVQMQAASQGEIDITTPNAAATLTAMDAGLPFKFFLGRYVNEFAMVASTDVTECADLDGLRIAIHSPTDITGLLLDDYLARECPAANPEIQVIDGSENRLAGILQGQIDATIMDIQSVELLFAERPDEYHVFANFPEDVPVLAGVYAANPEWMAENEELVKDFIRVQLDIFDDIYSNPDILVQETLTRLPEVDPAQVPNIVDRVIENEVFARDGGLGDEQAQLTLDFFNEAGGYESIQDLDDMMDRSYLDEVLAER